MVSQQVFDMLNLKITVYGLDEYNQLPKDTPIGVMLCCPGMGQTQKHLEKLCNSLCSLNNNKKTMGDRYIMAATVDQPLQGTRIRDGHKLCLPTAKLNDQPTFGMDCHSNVMKTALSFTSLVDVFETCVFGKQADGLVDKWGVIGFSMGGYSALQAAASDPRISITIALASTLDPIKMFRGTVRALNLDEDFYVPKRFKEQLEQRCKNVHTQFTHTHLLLVNGDKDPLFPPAINESLLEKLRTGRLGREGTDWKQVRVPEGQHFISKDYIMEATRWTHTWMSQPTVLCEARL